MCEKFEAGSWSKIQEPQVGEAIFGYATIFYAGNHYYFGGYDHTTKRLNSIHRLQESTWTWSNVGQMKTTREAHQVILVGDRFIIIGGIKTKKNEVCLLNNGHFKCTEFSSSLKNYAYYPILHLVSDNYKNC